MESCDYEQELFDPCSVQKPTNTHQMDFQRRGRSLLQEVVAAGQDRIAHFHLYSVCKTTRGGLETMKHSALPRVLPLGSNLIIIIPLVRR